MANENEDVKNESARNNEKPEHHSIAGKIIDKIEDVIENMDTDFPLSGGEEHPVHHHEHEEEKPGEQPKEEHHKTSFLDDLNTEFPLSGGETER